MLVASKNGVRVDARNAIRGEAHRCPGCNAEVILKRGRRVIAHFAHKPPVDCSWGKGETHAHRYSKALVADALTERGLNAEVEFEVETLTGDRRADVMTWHPGTGQAIAIELQHSTIDLDNIEARARSYASAGIAQFWIGFLSKNAKDKALPDGKDRWKIEQYSARPFENWISGFNMGKGFWMYDPFEGCFWNCEISDHHTWVEETTRYDEYGEEHYHGGYWRKSKRWKELTMWGPYHITDLKLKLFTRSKAFGTSRYWWPAGRGATFS